MTPDVIGKWVALVLAIFGVLGVGTCGCQGPGYASPFMHDISVLLQNPAVQATIERWNVDSDVTNPSVGFYLVTGGEVRANGIILRGTASGSRTGGLDPELLKVLTAVAIDYGYQPASTQPAKKEDPTKVPAGP